MANFLKTPIYTIIVFASWKYGFAYERAKIYSNSYTVTISLYHTFSVCWVEI